MSTYTDYLLNTSALNTVALYTFGEGSGTTATDLAPSPANGSYGGSPTLSGSGNDYGQTTKSMLSVAGTSYASIPTTKFGTGVLAGNWSMVTWMKYEGTDLGVGEPTYGIEGIGSGGANTFSMFLRSDGGLSTTNFLTFYMTNGAGTEKHATSAPLSALLYDQAWHMVVVTHSTAAGGTLTVYVDGTAGTPVTNVDGSLPSSLAGTYGICARFESGAIQTATFGSSMRRGPWSFHTTALTPTQIFAMADRMNGNLGAKVEYPVATRAMFTKAQNQIVALAMIGDSNAIKGSSAVGGQLVQGFVLTTPTWIYGATSKKLASFMVGTSQPSVSGVVFLGVNAQLLNGGGLGTIAHVTNRNLEYWNTNVSTNADASRGFRADCKYFPTGTLVGADSNITCDTSNQNWSLDTSGNFKFWYEYGTFSTGSGQIVPSVTVNGVLISFTPTSTNIGLNGWSYTSTAAAAVAAGQTFKFGFASTGHDATGPLAGGAVHIVNTGRTNGFTLGTLWANGGHSAFTVCQALADTTNTPRSKLEAWLLQLILPQLDRGQTPCLVIQILEGPNDRSETGNPRSYTYTRGTDTFSQTGNAYSQTRDGYKNNCNTIIDRVKDAANAVGIADANVIVVFGPYHQIAVDPGDWKMQQQYARAEREICDGLPTTGLRFSGPDIVSATAMLAANGYDDTSGSVDYLHLLRAGYALMGTNTGIAAAPYAGNPVAKKLLLLLD